MRKRVMCKKCDGNGEHKKPFSGEQIWYAPFTLGLSLIRDSVRCKVCEGKGYTENMEPVPKED